ncbi:hypothetical protein OIU85_009377 [Salix viminalis]|uniref:Kinesin motor domain-containing protein n=1 Tax=Salix viminalis TaxID=40686 RepID=A0A9Q0NUE2_SALVM|nr:hypothetical protein OIU85_009377 [Salix viminalis]
MGARLHVYPICRSLSLPLQLHPNRTVFSTPAAIPSQPRLLQFEKVLIPGSRPLSLPLQLHPNRTIFSSAAINLAVPSHSLCNCIRTGRFSHLQPSTSSNPLFIYVPMLNSLLQFEKVLIPGSRPLSLHRAINMWPPIGTQVQDIINNMRSLCSSIPSCMDTTPHNDGFNAETSTDIGETTTLNSSMRVSNRDITSFSTWEKFNAHSTGMKNALAQDYLRLLNTADKEVLKKLKGIGEKRANYILELREDSPEPFKNLDDLKVIGLSAKQVKRWF